MTWRDIRELKQWRYWAADVNRKFMFLLLARFHARPMSCKALILTFTTWLFEWLKRVKYASKRRSLDFRLTSVAQKRLCLSSLMQRESRTSKDAQKQWVETPLNWRWKEKKDTSREEGCSCRDVFIFKYMFPFLRRNSPNIRYANVEM